MNTQLYRSNSDRVIAGVCGGLSHYLRIDVTLVRLFFILLTLGDGIGMLLYFILWLVMPSEDRVAGGDVGDHVRTEAGEIASRAQEMGDDVRRAVSSPTPQAGILVGAALIILGSLSLLNNLDLPWLRWFSYDLVWPVLLIAGGIVLLTRERREA
jgi:phage shock protein C